MDLHSLYQKKYSASRLLSLAWKEYRENFWTLLMIVLIIHAPLNLAGMMISGMVSGENILPAIPIILVFAVLSLAAGILSELAIPYAIKSSIEGRKIDYKEALSKAAEKWRCGIYVELMMILFLIPLFILFILPGLLYSVYWIFGAYAVILSDKKGRDALDHSKKIVKGRWWAVFLYSLFFAFITFMAIIPAAIMQYLSPANIFTELFYNTLINAIFVFYSVSLILLYLNLEAIYLPTARNP